MSAARRKGTSAETTVVGWLRQSGWPYAERRALAGAKDLGDITGTPGIVWEVKAGSRLCIPEWLAETDVEKANAAASVGMLVVKPKGVGATNVHNWWVIQPLNQATWLLRVAGYGGAGGG